MSKDTITVYWTPAAFNHDQESWNMLYQEPESVYKKIQKNNFSKDAFSMKICPAVKDATKNLFVIKSNIEESFVIDTDMAKKVINDNQENALISVEGDAKLGLRRARRQEYENHLNYIYNLSWLFFANEPLEVKFTSPYLPPSSPIEQGFLAPGQFDIGQWYRKMNLEYIVPESSKYFSIKEDQELFYLQFLTDKKIIFKRYILSEKLKSLSLELSESPSRYGRFKSLKQRYLMASKSNVQKIILSEIKKNLIED